MLELLKTLDAALRDNRPDYHATLLPGVDDTALTQFESRFGVSLPPDFRDLYRWRNGQSPNNSSALIRNRMFMSIGDIIETKEMLDSMIGEDFDDPRWWRNTWIPFLSNGGGDYLCIDTLAEDGGTSGQLIAFRHDWEKRSVEFPNLRTWLLATIDSVGNEQH